MIPRAKRYGNLLAVAGGFVFFALAIVLSWNRLVSRTDLVILAVMYVPTALGITVGYHRLLSHRAFKTPKPIRYLFAVLGSMAVQGPVIEWVTDHRKHHSSSDREGDPHSPHVGHGDGIGGALRGLWHAHVGWLFRTQGQATAELHSRDLLRDPGIVFIDRAFGLFVILSLAIPFALGYAATATLQGGLTALLWGGFVRIFLMHHVTFSVNSICHVFGQRPFAVKDHSGNVPWLCLLTMGESWHHNHHAFPRSAAHGLRWWQLDPSWWLIRALQALGLAHDPVKVSPAQQRARIAEPEENPLTVSPRSP